MRLLVGLGNPGANYALNRHNIGFMALDVIAERYRFAPWRTRFQGEVSEGAVDGNKVLALKPTTYMNLSGQSVGEAMRFFKMSPADVIVFHDEIELAAGRLRVKQGGGSAGHNGIRSLDDHIGNDFWRVRMGVGRPGGPEDKSRVKGHVLENFAKSDVDWLGPLLDAVATALPLLLLGGGDSKFMTKVALLTKPPAPKKEKKADEPTDKSEPN
jgi:PTH1 family peptidyl-tRNA hydrolase